MPDPIVSALIIAVLILLTTTLSLADRWLFRTWLTPFTLLAAPYTVVVLLAYAIGPALGFVDLYTPSVLIWLGGLAAFWAGGWIAVLPLRWTAARRPRRLALELRYEDTTRKPMLLLSWLCILALSLSAARLLLSMGGFSALGTDAFTAVYNRGITGHLFVISQLLLVFWIGSLRRLRVSELVTVGALLAVNLLYQGKGALMIPVIAGILYRLLANRLRLGWRSVLLIAAAGYLMFNAIYLLTFSSGNPMALFDVSAYTELFYHFWTFLFAGVLGWSNLVRYNVQISAPPSFLVEPLLNLAAVALRLDLLTGSVGGFDYMLINPFYGKVTNVLTMFGVMQAALGTLGTLLAALLMGAGYYALLVVTLRTRNCWLVVAYTFCAAVLCFGWFSYFFSLLTYLEAPILCLFLALFAWAWDQRRLSAHSQPRDVSVPG